MADVGIKITASDQTGSAFNSVATKLGAVKKEAAGLGDTVGGLVGTFSALGITLGAGLSVAAVKNAIDTADAFSKMAQKTGVAVEQLRELNYAASLSDVSTEALGTGLRKLSVAMAGAAGGNKEQVAVFKALGVNVKDASGSLKGADAVLTEVAAKFASFKDGPEKAALAVQVFGKSGAELIPLLNAGASGLSDMAQEARDLGAVFSGDMAKQAEAFNDNLTRIGVASQGAFYSIANELLPTLNQLSQAFLDAQKSSSGFGGTIGGALKTIIEAAVILYSDVEFVLKGIGREFGAVGAQMAALARADFKGFAAISEAVKADGVRARAELDKFQYDLLNAGILNSKAGAGRGTAADPRILGSTQTTAPIVSAAATTAAKTISEAAKGLALYNDLMDKSAGFEKTWAEDVNKLRAALDGKTISQTQFNAAVQALLAIQPGMVAAAKAEADWQKEAAKAYEDAYTAQAKAASTAAEALQNQLEQNAAIGLTVTGLADLEAAKLTDQALSKDSLAITADLIDFSGQLGAQYRAEAQALRDLASAKISGAQKRASVDAAKDMAAEQKKAAEESKAEWDKYADQIGQSLTDQIMEGGRNGAAYLTNLFRTMVLRPIIQGVLQPVATALTGSLIGTAANAATGQAATGGLIGSMLPPSSMGALDIAGFTLPQIGMGIAALGILKSLGAFGSNFISATDTGGARADYTGSGVGGGAYLPSGGSVMSAATTKAVDDLAQSYFKTASALGIKAMQATFEYGTNSGREGAAPQTVLGVNIGKVGYSSGEIASTDAAGLSLAASRAVLTALQASELPSYLAGVFDDITVSTATQEQITTALTSAGALATFNKELQALPFSNLADLSYSATQSLIKFSGGLDTLKTNLGTYYSNFYTAEEQRAQTIANINKATFGSGLDAANATRESFRRIVEAQDLSTESGRAMYAALISVSGAFAGLTPVLDSVAATVTTTVDALQVAMARAQNANALADSAMAALTASIDAEKSALSQKYESDLSKLTAAQDAYTQSVTDSISSVSDGVSKLQSLSNRLRSSLTNTMIGTDGQQRQSAQALIASVLAVAKSGGGLPKDTTALESALSTVAKPSEKLFGSFEDYARDFYKTSNDIAALSGITDTTLTAQQAMLAQLEAQSAISKAAYSSQAKLLKDQYDQAVKGLDTTLASAQKQLDALHGIDTSVLSVSAAIDRLAAALGIAKTTQTTSNAVTDDTIRGYIANLKTGGGTEADMVITLAKRAKEVGVTQADIARAMSMTEADVASYFASFGIPKFAQGTNYVPSDMVAMVHEGEAIIPKAYNPSAANTGNSDTAAALRALADRLDRIEANTRATAGHTAGTDRKLARVIPGNALITEAAV